MLIFIVAGEITNSISKVKDGLTHRYYGFYWQLIERLREEKCKAFWYATSERKLYSISENKSLKLSLLYATSTVFKNGINSGTPVVVMIDYPHSFRGFKFFLEYTIFLLVLHFFKKISRVPFMVICDNMDPPLEHAHALQRNVKIIELLLWTFLNKLVYSFDLMVALSEGYRIYLAKRYGIPLEKIITIPSGTFAEYIPYTKPVIGEKLIILYAGNLDERMRDLAEQIICAVNELRSYGHAIEFIITGKNLIGNLRHAEGIKILGGLNYIAYLHQLVSSHVFLLLYPRCLHNDLATFAKFSDYMSTGRIILTTDIMMTSKIVRDTSSGFNFKNVAEFKRILTNIYDNRHHIIEDMGVKARKWAESNSYRTLVEKMVSYIKKRLGRIQ
jgi:glycosyltransferase involved in cell wall biosynthesis